MSSAMPPVVIRTARLLIRSWQPGDGPLLKQAIDANLAHLRPWMPWALDEPSAPDVVEARVQQFADRFARGEDWIYALFAPDGSRRSRIWSIIALPASGTNGFGTLQVWGRKRVP